MFSGLVRGTSCSYYFFSTWLRRFSKMMQTVTVFSISPPLFLSWRVSYIIYPLLVDLDPPFVDHAGRYSSACPICHLPKPSVSCSNQGSIAQGVISSLMWPDCTHILSPVKSSTKLMSLFSIKSLSEELFLISVSFLLSLTHIFSLLSFFSSHFILSFVPP